MRFDIEFNCACVTSKLHMWNMDACCVVLLLGYDGEGQDTPSAPKEMRVICKDGVSFNSGLGEGNILEYKNI